MTQRFPTFREVRTQHDITLHMLIEDAQVDPAAVLLLDTWSIGEAGIVDLLLASLSRLSGTEYRRDLLNIGGFTFSVNPPYERVAEAVAMMGQECSQGGDAAQDEDTPVSSGRTERKKSMGDTSTYQFQYYEGFFSFSNEHAEVLMDEEATFERYMHAYLMLHGMDTRSEEELLAAATQAQHQRKQAEHILMNPDYWLASADPNVRIIRRSRACQPVQTNDPETAAVTEESQGCSQRGRSEQAEGAS